MKEKFSTGAIWLWGVIAAATAAVINVVVATVSATIVGASPELVALQPGPVITTTLVTMLAGTAVFTILSRLVQRRDACFDRRFRGDRAQPGCPHRIEHGHIWSVRPRQPRRPARALIPLHLIPAVTLVAALVWIPKRDHS